MALVDDSIVVPSLAPLYAGKFPPSAPPPPPPPPPPGLVLANVPSSGTVGAAATGATVTNTSSTSAASWALSSSGGLTISPTLGTLAAGASQAVSLTAAAPGAYSLLLENNSGGSVTGSPVTFTAAAAVATATAFTLTISPSSGTNGSPATVTVTPNAALSAACTVTLSASTGATLGVSTLSFASGATASLSTTVTRATSGSSTVSMSNSLGLTNNGSPRTFTSAGLSVGGQVATLTVYNESGIGTRPFVATVLPLRGVVPSGSTLTDAAGVARASILSTHTDGSAAVVVLAGTASAAGTVAVHAATGTDSTALGAAAISAQVTSVSVAFGSPYGTASISDFSTPERIWWQNSRYVCARYRVAAPTPGSTALEAVIDIHAWADRALVEVVVENAKMTTATPTKPTAASYTGATVSINGGAAIATADATGVTSETGHNAFRAWYASGWVGGNPGLRVTQLHTELQSHPLLFQPAVANSADLSVYAADAYTPWTDARHPFTNMGGFGDVPGIGPLPQWEAQFLQTGDYRAALATEVSALAVLSWNVNYRDATTGLVPTATELQGKTQTGSTANWPRQTNGSDNLCWEVAHHPAAGLMAFVCRPSPVFIEIAQKICVWNATYSAESTNLGGWSGWADSDYTGIFGNAYQMRGRAWGLRSLAHATFLTPDAHAWKAGGQYWLGRNATYLNKWSTDSKATLKFFWDNAPTDQVDAESGTAKFQTKLWQHHYLTTELHKAARARLLTGASQTLLETVADWAALQPVEWVNQQPDGGWRYIPYHTTAGRNASTIDSAATWALQMADHYGADASSGASGPILTSATATPLTHAAFAQDVAFGALYPSYWWAALVAAVERGVAGAATAWATVNANATNLSTCLAGGATDPRWVSYPREGIAPAWVAGVSTTQWTELTTAQTFTGYANTALAPASGAYRGSGGTTGAIAAIRDAFCQYAFDHVSNAAYFFGGGHQDGSCNAVVKFDLSTLTYSTVVAATPPAKYPPAFTQPNLPIQYPSTYIAPDLLPNGCFETAPPLTDSADTPYAVATRARSSSHSYAAMSYWNGLLTIHYGQVGDADTVTGDWSYLTANPYGSQFAALNVNYTTYGLPSGTNGVTDQINGKAWMSFVASTDTPAWRSHMAKIDIATKTVDALVPINFSGGMNTRTSVCIQGRKVWLTGPTVSGPTASVSRVASVDMDTNAVTYYSVTGTLATWTDGSATQEVCPIFHNGTDLYAWSYSPSGGKDRLFKIETSAPSSGAGTSGSPYVVAGTQINLTASAMSTGSALTYRLDYVPAWGVVVINPSSGSRWWALSI